MAVAHTGTGKTARFSLPMLQLLAAKSIQNESIQGCPSPQPQCVRALIITPNRELAAQGASSVQNYSRHMSIHSTAVFSDDESKQ